MRCANCGGTIHVNEPCVDCGIAYDEMLANISHDEMRRLFARIEELMENHKSIDIEASLMACELLNSSLILPAQIGDDSLGFLRIPGFDDNYYVVFCTDMNEFEKFKSDFTPLTNSWRMFLELLEEESDGIVINLFDEACFLGKPFIDQFFRGDSQDADGSADNLYMS